MRIVQYFLAVTFTVCLIASLLITSVEAVVYWTPGYFQYEYEKNKVLDDVHMEMEDLLEVTDHMMAYLRGNRQELQIVTLVNGVERNFFSQREIDHMADVKVLFMKGLALRRFAIMVGGLCLIAFWAIKGRQKKVLPRAICFSSGIFIGLTGLSALIISLDFTRYFNLFHGIFFDNDLWILNPDTDLLINIVPEAFFVHTAGLIGFVFAMAMMVLVTAAAISLRRKKGSAKREEKGAK